VFRGQAFRQQGFHDAAHEALKEALRSRSRAAPIRHLALAERAQNYIVQGKKGMARKDLGWEECSSPRVHRPRRSRNGATLRTCCRNRHSEISFPGV
jgi:hypothetical protein